MHNCVRPCEKEPGQRRQETTLIALLLQEVICYDMGVDSFGYLTHFRTRVESHHAEGKLFGKDLHLQYLHSTLK